MCFSCKIGENEILYRKENLSYENKTTLISPIAIYIHTITVCDLKF